MSPSNHPQTIEIFLPRGDPAGLRLASLTTGIVQVIEVPRPLLDDFLQMEESAQDAVYYLVGPSEKSGEPVVYVGQTGAPRERLLKHHKEKGFWNRALVLISRIKSLTPTHTLYLEWRCIQAAKDAQRYGVENGKAGSKPHTPAPQAADCEVIFEAGRTLLATLGYPLFQPAHDQPAGTKDEVFHCTARGAAARGLYLASGFVVLKGSKAPVEPTPNFADSPLNAKRLALIEEGVLAHEGKALTFTRDYEFATPSSAATIVAGNAMNGWKTWKDAKGQTLDELKRQS